MGDQGQKRSFNVFALSDLTKKKGFSENKSLALCLHPATWVFPAKTDAVLNLPLVSMLEGGRWH